MKGQTTATSWPWVVVVACVLLATSACDGMEPVNQAPHITSLGPITSEDSGVTIAFSIFDEEGDVVEVEVWACHEGQRCANDTCVFLRGIEGGQPLRVRGDQGSEASVHTRRWWPGCEGNTIDMTKPLMICVVPKEGVEMTSPWMVLSHMGVLERDAPCPLSIPPDVSDELHDISVMMDDTAVEYRQ